MSSGFITETELAEAKKRRQEEWEKVRTADQPVERPEEEYDSRSLYERLKEQKLQKDMDYEESHKLKNMIRGLNDDEVEFLEMVDKNKMDSDLKQMAEDNKEINEFRNRVANLQEESIDKKIQSELNKSKNKSSTNFTPARPSQKSLLSAGIKRKLSTETKSNDTSRLPYESVNIDGLNKGALQCIAILPGIGTYTDSSDSELSSDSDDEPKTKSHAFDLTGRRCLKRKQCLE